MSLGNTTFGVSEDPCFRMEADAGGQPAAASHPALVYIDPRSLSRDSISGYLARSLSDFRIHAVANVQEVAALADRDDSIMLILLSIGSQGAGCPETVDAIAVLTRNWPHIPVAVLADNEDYGEILAALRIGIRGYIPTSLASAVVPEAVRLICAGDTYAPSSCLLRHADRQKAALGGSAPSRTPHAGFSPRQQQILRCLGKGMANKQIAYALSMSEGTVKIHVRKIMRKLNAANRTQVVVMTLNLFQEI